MSKTKKTRSKEKPKARGRTGRKRAAVFEWPIWDTIAQAAEVLKWPPSLLRQLKKAGCPGFRYGRVYFGEIVVWLGQRGLDDPDIDWSRELKKEQALRERIKRKKDERQAIDFGEVSDKTMRYLAMLFSSIDRVFLRELPPIVKGLGEKEIAVRFDKEISQMRADAEARFQKLIEKEPDEAAA